MIPEPAEVRALPRPALAAWACVALGLMVGRGVGVGAGPWLALAAVGAGVAAGLALRGGPRPRRRSWVLPWLALGAVALSAASMRARVIDPAARAPRLAGPAGSRALVAVEGVALDHPEYGPPTPGAFASFLERAPVTRVRLRAARLRDAGGWRPLRGVIYLRVGEVTLPIRAGDRIHAEGFFSPIAGPVNPGEPDGRVIAAQRGVIGRLLAPTSANVSVLGRTTGLLARSRNAFLRLRADTRARARGWLRDSVAGLDTAEDPARALLAALLLGDRDSDALRDIDESMRRVGAAHLLSISGLHLGILVWMAVLALRALGVRRGVDTVLLAGFIALYLFVVPARTPIIRAGAAALVWLLAESIGRRYHPLALLAWIGVGVLIWRPLDLWSAGYQLSFGVVAGILVLTPIVAERWRPAPPEPDARTVAQSIGLFFERAVIVAVCAWAVAAPIVIYHFGVVSPLGAVASLVLYPLIAATLGVGAVAIILAAALPTAGALLGGVLTAIGRLITGLTFALDALPGAAFTTPPVSLWWTLAAEGVVVWLLARGARRSWRDWTLAALIALWLAGFWFRPMLPSGQVVRLDTFAVGDGSAHLIRTRDGAALWDAGSSHFWLAQRDLPRAVRALGAWPVRTIVLTHPNLDHYAAIPDLIRPLGVREVVVGRATTDAARAAPAGPVAALLDSIERRGARIRAVSAGDRVTVGRLHLDILHPDDTFTAAEVNNWSLVARLTAPTAAGPRVILLTGDIEGDAMAALRASHPALRADVLELPHHGSARPAAYRFVRALDPKIVVQSTGPSRLDDARWAGVRPGRVWLTTARDGALSVIIGRDGEISAASFGAGVVSAGAGRARDTAR